MTPREISKERSKLINSLKTTVRPYLRASSYRQPGSSRPVQVWVARNQNGDISLRVYELKSGFLIRRFKGFTSQGVVIDIEDSGLNVLDYGQIPVEDLYSLSRWAERKFAGMRESAIRQLAQSRYATHEDCMNLSRYEERVTSGNGILVVPRECQP